MECDGVRLNQKGWELSMAKQKYRNPLQVLAEYESEISSYGVPPPKPWPWGVDVDGRTYIALRFHQLAVFINHLREGRIPKHDGKWSRDFNRRRIV
jgi:hypothetical protein